MEHVLGLLAVELRVPEVREDEVDVGAAREDVETRGLRVLRREPVGEDPRAADRALLAVPEVVGRRELEGRGLGRDDVHERAALLTGEDVGVELLREVGLVGEDEARAGAADRLVHRRGDDVRVRDGRGVEPGGHEAGEVRHVDPERRSDLVGDLAEQGEVELARVGGPAGDDDARLVLAGLGADVLHVDEHGVGVDPVGDGVVELAREVELHAVGEVAAVREFEAEDRVAGLRDRGEDGGVGARAGVRLDVGVRGAEEALRPLDRERLGDVDELAAAVVAAAGVALRVLVREDGALRLQHGDRDEVLARDHLEVVALPAELLLEDGGDLRVDLAQRGVEQVLGGGDGCVGHRTDSF